MREKFIIYNQTHTGAHTSQTPRPQAISLHAHSQSEGPHRHVLDKDRQIRRQLLRLTTAFALITGWPAMKETDDMSLFVFSSSALNRVNTAVPVMLREGGRGRERDIQREKRERDRERERAWLRDESPTHQTQVFAHQRSEQSPEVKGIKGTANKTFGWQLMPRKTD